MFICLKSASYLFQSAFNWLLYKSPKNKDWLTLNLALEVIELYCSRNKNKDEILVFVGVD